MTWIAHVKRAAAVPPQANNSTSDVLLPRFPWTAASIGDSWYPRVLVAEALPVLEAIVLYFDECSDLGHAAAAVRLYYDTPSIVKMLCFLFLQSYHPFARQDWSRVADSAVARKPSDEWASSEAIQTSIQKPIASMSLWAKPSPRTLAAKCATQRWFPLLVNLRMAQVTSCPAWSPWTP
jgi:hypothetical protein